MTKTTNKKEEGRWGQDPRGVKFVSFEIPEKVKEKKVEFRFKTPTKKEEIGVTVENQEEVLGIIILFKPDYEEV